MVPGDKTVIEQWRQSLRQSHNHEISLGLLITKNRSSLSFSSFCEELIELIPEITLKKETSPEDSPPAIKIGSNISYQALPAEKELEPFLQALTERVAPTGRLNPVLQDKLKTLKVPAFIKIYITPHCPFCPQMVQKLLILAIESELIRLTIIDGTLFPDLAQKDKIQSAPTILLDDQFRWTGAVDSKELVELILKRDPAQLSPASLQGLIEDGKAAEIADLMIRSGRIFSSFLKLLLHDKWPVRLGAMVAYETLLERAPHLADQVLDPLWDKFTQVDDQVKGDILYIIGESGQKKMRDKLQVVMAGNYGDEILEAAAEALENLQD